MRLTAYRVRDEIMGGNPEPVNDYNVNGCPLDEFRSAADDAENAADEKPELLELRLEMLCEEIAGKTASGYDSDGPWTEHVLFVDLRDSDAGEWLTLRVEMTPRIEWDSNATRYTAEPGA
jgi:hypothetical protein